MWPFGHRLSEAQKQAVNRVMAECDSLIAGCLQSWEAAIAPVGSLYRPCNSLNDANHSGYDVSDEIERIRADTHLVDDAREALVTSTYVVSKGP